MASLELELTCSVCRDVFSQVHPLPCGHSFCPACIREAWSDLVDGRSRFICPQCQEERGEVRCDCCPAGTDEEEPGLAVKTCLRCEVSLCADHLQPHLERPAFSSHLLVDPLGDLSHRRCPEHAEILRYYCADDRLYVCGDCLLEGGHAQHKVKALRQVEEELKVSRESGRGINSFLRDCFRCSSGMHSAGHSPDPAQQSRREAERRRENPPRIRERRLYHGCESVRDLSPFRLIKAGGGRQDS